MPEVAKRTGELCQDKIPLGRTRSGIVTKWGFSLFPAFADVGLAKEICPSHSSLTPRIFIS